MLGMTILVQSVFVGRVSRRRNPTGLVSGVGLRSANPTYSDLTLRLQARGALRSGRTDYPPSFVLSVAR